MSVFKKKLTLGSHGTTPTFINITEELRAAIAESGIREGIATEISPHTPSSSRSSCTMSTRRAPSSCRTI